MNELLKFITCGSVDDGKSTLIGHMLYDAKLLFADQKQALLLDSKVGSCGGEIDYSLLLDGLMAEREQGITIDVAYRYFSTEKRSFIVADTPGHEEYTRNMAVGASFADLTVILVDASKGLLVQTRRHTRICSLMGIRHFIFAINKMDLIQYDEKLFKKIDSDIKELMSEFPYETLQVFPVSATKGDNLTNRSLAMSWYEGKTLLSYLETVQIQPNRQKKEFLLPVQRVCRPNANFRGFQGQVVQGKLSVGDEVTVLPSNEKAHIQKMLNTNINAETVFAGQPVTLVLDKEVDVSRGCVITGGAAISMSRLFRAKLLWMDNNPLIEGRNYLLKLGTNMIPATVLKINNKTDVNTGDKLSVTQGKKNELLSCDISISEKIPLDAYENISELGRFILIDTLTFMTSACGIISYSLRRSDNLTYQYMDIERNIRAAQKNQTPMTLWFTGLSGSGKSTIANALEKQLVSLGRHTMLLDGDNIRMGLNKDLGFTETDRVENIRRIAETAKLMNDAGLIVLVAAISPFQADRQYAKKIIGSAFREVFVSTSLQECENRDVKGLYKKARDGKIPNFTGISSPYEIPKHADIVVKTEEQDVEQCVHTILTSIGE